MGILGTQAARISRTVPLLCQVQGDIPAESVEQAQWLLSRAVAPVEVRYRVAITMALVLVTQRLAPVLAVRPLQPMAITSWCHCWVGQGFQG